MKICAAILAILILAGTVFAADLHPYRVPAAAREALLEMNATVDHGRLAGDYIAFLTLEQARGLQASGYLISPLSEAEATGSPLAETDEFHTYEQMRTTFLAYAAAHPDIAQYVILGHSVQNRELFAMKISDNVTAEENEPEVVFWGGIHGNEYAGGEMPYLYALYLCDNYGTDPSVATYVNNNQIWCIPQINPDGRAMSQRDNANGVDLNRDLGYEWYGQGSSPAPLSQVENHAIREFVLSHPVAISTTFHCSGDYCLYPWGFGPQNIPDLAINLRAIQRYAAAASYTYVNSWQDYETHGELLDYVYGIFGGICFTVEINPLSSLVPTTFERNKAGMNLFCASSGQGFSGVITDSATGQPLQAAIWMVGNPIPSYSNPQSGYMHRIVPPGTYTLKVWANGYLPKTIPNIVVTQATPGWFQAALHPGGGENAFMVTSVNQRDPNNAHANNTFPAWALGAPDGYPVSLGTNGFIVLDMGAGHEIVNGPGNDFTVTEALFNRDPQPESYQVFAGDAYTQNSLIGSGTGTTSFDLAAAGINSTRYLKILDQSGASPNLPYAGMDLDAVTVLNSAAMLAASGQPFPGETGEPRFAESASRSGPTGGLCSATATIDIFPNPFNPITAISYQLQATSQVSLRVYDTAGRLVATLVDGRQEAGQHNVTFDGSKLASGLYFVRMQAENHAGVQKLMLLK